jgi:hypothetical protein
MKHRPSVAVGALVLVALLVLAPLIALAQVEGDAVDEPTVESQKIFDLAMCAISIATIETGLGALTAVVTCGRAAYVWWSV